jgi:hypothetical protein
VTVRGAGREVAVARYEPNRWRQLTLRVSPRKRTFSVAVQDPTLQVTARQDLGFQKTSGDIGRLVLAHGGRRSGSWVLYNAVTAYQQ